MPPPFEVLTKDRPIQVLSWENSGSAMTEKPSDPEQSTPPEDIARLYARARTPGSSTGTFQRRARRCWGSFRHRIAREPAEPRQRCASPRTFPQCAHLTSRGGGKGRSSPARAKQTSRRPAPSPIAADRTAAHRTAWPHAGMPCALSLPRRRSMIHARPRTPATHGCRVFARRRSGKDLPGSHPGACSVRPGEHVLLADTAACGPLPLYFGSREFKPGVVRTFSPPGAERTMRRYRC